MTPWRTLIQQTQFAGERLARINLASAIGYSFEITDFTINNQFPAHPLDANHLVIAGSGDDLPQLIPNLKALYPQMVKIYLGSIFPKDFTQYASAFDMIVGPLGQPGPRPINYVEILGVVPTITETEIQYTRQKNALSGVRKIALFLGGNTLMVKGYNQAFCQTLSSMLDRMLQHDDKLIIVDSPRTPVHFLKELRSWEQKPPHTLEMMISATRNIYIDALRDADIIIATVDSMSIITEGCLTGKPVYVIMNDGLAEMPHYLFCEHLVTAGVIRKLENHLDVWQPALFENPMAVITHEILKQTKKRAAFKS